VRGNLRSKGALDVSKVARLMGGGGHKAAAGFTFEGDIDEALAAVLPPLRRLLNEERN
jgi:phosphoesterase RecJ-like protein